MAGRAVGPAAGGRLGIRSAPPEERPASRPATETVVRSLSEYLERLQDLRLADRPHFHVRWWFRGQPDKGRELIPGVYRDGFPAARGDEAKRLSIEQHVFADFRLLAAGLISPPPSAIDLYFVQQHYGLPTRLLDRTTNPLAGRYFAVNTGPDTDGSVVMMDVYRLAETQGAVGHFRGIVNSTDPRLREWLAPVLEWGEPEDFCDYVVPLRPEQLNTRVRLQRGCFTLHVPERPALTERENDSLRTFVVPKGHKEAVYRELKLSGIDEFAIFGDLENLAVSLKAAYGL